MRSRLATSRLARAGITPVPSGSTVPPSAGETTPMGKLVTAAGAFTQVSAGGYHTCGLRSDGHVGAGEATRVSVSTAMNLSVIMRTTWGKLTPPHGRPLHAGQRRPDTTLVDSGPMAASTAGEITPPAQRPIEPAPTRRSARAMTTPARSGARRWHHRCWGDDAKGRAQSQIGPFSRSAPAGRTTAPSDMAAQ